jgi:release factor glutamine methyltransferase
LKDEGELFFEINENLGKETAELLQRENFSDVELKKDLHGKMRMLKCRK